MKVMLSLKTDTVQMLDALAERRNTTRSGMVAALAVSEYQRITEERQASMLHLLGEPRAYDGAGTQHVAEDRRR